MNILGIDYGLKNIGLAISWGSLVESLCQIKIKTGVNLINRIKTICLQNKINLIVLGLPKGKLALKVKNFRQKLEKSTNLPICYQDETLTSKEAVVKMIEAGKPLLKRRKSKHMVSACLILQSYLDHTES